MNADDLILIMLSHSEEQMIAGRTLLQKIAYFLNVKMDLDIEFTPYYYGPYSREIAESLASLKSCGIIKEEVREYMSFDFNVTYEPRKYTYSLTEIGLKIAKDIEKENPSQTFKIACLLLKLKEFGVEHDYKNLSIAAKMHNILIRQGRPLAISEILDEAKALGWNISSAEAQNAVDLLNKCKLVTGV
jgi:uncharacterized protein